MSVDRPPAKPVPIGLICCIGWLALLVTVTHFWTQRHLGFSVTEALTSSVGVSFFVSMFGSVLALFREEKQATKYWKRLLQRAARMAVSPWLLLAGTVAVFAVGSSLASVQITAGAAADVLEVSIAPELIRGQPAADADVWKLKSGETRSDLYLTTLFGRRYRLTAPGYRPYSFELAPWTGATLEVPDCLERKPTVVVRIPPGPATMALEAARFRLSILEPNTSPPEVLSELRLTENHRAVLLGEASPIPASSLSVWSLELMATGLTPAVQAQQLLGWRDPQPADLKRDLVPGTRLRAELISDDTANPRVLARCEFTITNEAFQDVSLTPAK